MASLGYILSLIYYLLIDNNLNYYNGELDI